MRSFEKRKRGGATTAREELDAQRGITGGLAASARRASFRETFISRTMPIGQRHLGP